MIDGNTIMWTVLGTFGLQVLIATFSFGRLKQKLDDLEEEVHFIRRHVFNGVDPDDKKN